MDRTKALLRKRSRGYLPLIARLGAATEITQVGSGFGKSDPKPPDQTKSRLQ